HVGVAVPERAVHLLGQVAVGGGDAVVPHRLAVAVAEQLPALPQVLVVRIDARADVRIGARPVAGYDVEAFADQADLRAPLPGLHQRAPGLLEVDRLAGQPRQREIGRAHV